MGTLNNLLNFSDIKKISSGSKEIELSFYVRQKGRYNGMDPL